MEIGREEKKREGNRREERVGRRGTKKEHEKNSSKAIDRKRKRNFVTLLSVSNTMR
jgi:hypothetical protein